MAYLEPLIFIICFDNDSQWQQRLESMGSIDPDFADCHIRKWPGVLVSDEVKREELCQRGFFNKSSKALKAGRAGCALAHFAIWEHIRNNSDIEWCCVMKDDAIPHPNFVSNLRTIIDKLPDGISFNLCARRPFPDQDILSLPTNQIKRAEPRDFGTQRKPQLSNVNAVCYGIRREGASELLARAYFKDNPYCFENHIDWYVSHQMRDLQCYSLKAGKIITHGRGARESMVQSLDLRNTTYRRFKRMIKRQLKLDHQI